MMIRAPIDGGNGKKGAKGHAEFENAAPVRVAVIEQNVHKPIIG